MLRMSRIELMKFHLSFHPLFYLWKLFCQRPVCASQVLRLPDISRLLLVYLAYLHVLSVVPLKCLSHLFFFYLHLLTLLQAFILSCFPTSTLISFHFFTTSEVIFSSHIIYHVTHYLYLTLVLCTSPFLFI